MEENIIKKENHDKTDSDRTLLDGSQSLILKNTTDSSELFHNSNSALSEFIRQGNLTGFLRHVANASDSDIKQGIAVAVLQQDKDSLLKLIELCWRSPLCKPHATADATNLQQTSLQN